MSDGSCVRVAKWFESNSLYLTQWLSPIALTVLSVWIGVWAPDELKSFNELQKPDYWFWVKQWTPWFFLVAIILNIYGGIFGSRKSSEKDVKIFNLKKDIERLSPLSNQLEEAQLAIDQMRIDHAETIFHVTSDYLGHLSNDHLGYNDTERVSLYLHNGSRFILAGRYSKNLTFAEPRRTAFPDNEGCIGQTWSCGGKYFIELPDDEFEYYEYLKNDLSIDKGTAKSLRMKSKSYFSLAIEDGYRRIGIILFESLNFNILVEETILELIAEHSEYLKEMLKQTKTVNALVAYQNEEGTHERS